MAYERTEQSRRKRCFVTIGATASFNSLVCAVLDAPFLEALRDEGYTELRIQYGNEGQQVVDQQVRKLGLDVQEQFGIHLTGFDFNRSGLEGEMKAAKGDTPDREGTVISHAGSGSILDALRVGIPLIVVPNTDLLHNHQVELAEVLAEQSYVVYGKIENLAAAIPEIESLRKRMKKWPPINSGEDKYSHGLGGVMAEEMGWVD